MAVMHYNYYRIGEFIGYYAYPLTARLYSRYMAYGPTHSQRVIDYMAGVHDGRYAKGWNN